MKTTYLGLRSFGQGMAVEMLADKLGISESTVHRHIRRLKTLGVLQVKQQFQDGHQRTNFYLFPAPQWWVDPGQLRGATATPQKAQVIRETRRSSRGVTSPLKGCHRPIAKGQVSQGCHDTQNSPLVVTNESDVDEEEPSSVVSSSESPSNSVTSTR
jgi:biotin operon repressor